MCFTAFLNIAKAVKKQIKTSEKSLVIRQKDESRNVGNKTKHAKFSEKRTFFTPLGGKNIHFSENLACLVLLLPPFWDSPFCFTTEELMFKVILMLENAG